MLSSQSRLTVIGALAILSSSSFGQVLGGGGGTGGGQTPFLTYTIQQQSLIMPYPYIVTNSGTSFMEARVKGSLTMTNYNKQSFGDKSDTNWDAQMSGCTGYVTDPPSISEVSYVVPFDVSGTLQPGQTLSVKISYQLDSGDQVILLNNTYPERHKHWAKNATADRVIG